MVNRRLQYDFEDLDVQVLTADTSMAGLEIICRQKPDVVVLDVMLPDLSGLETFQRIHQSHPKIPVIFITASGESDTAIEAMKLGAYDYLLKPLDSRQVRELVLRAIEIHRLMETPVEFAERVSSGQRAGDILIGRCPAMQEVYKAIGRVAHQDVTVLIQGETGTGKELVARAIYHHSPRKGGPFLAINCAAIPETLLESELFGHEKGAFTGAERRRIGKFEQCTGGTLLLDEIGDMPPATQSKVLRLLQEQRFERLGGTETVVTDVRIIAATNHDLEKAIERESFRPDLYYRLNVFTIQLPPLRERIADLPLLLKHFLASFGRELGKDLHTISDDALGMLLRYPWPGNIRELQSIVKQAILNGAGTVLLPEFLPAAVRNCPSCAISVGSGGGLAPLSWTHFLDQRIETGSRDLYAESLARMEHELITFVLRHTGGNQLRAAEILGITRGTLRNKIRSLGIEIDAISETS